MLLQFPVANTGPVQWFFGIHSGTASASLAFQFNGTNYIVQLPMRVSTCSDRTCTETIGTAHPEYDALLLKFADRNGIPPQLIKSQIDVESGFNPNAYRYEPLSIDFARIAVPEKGTPFGLLNQKAYRPWPLAEARDCTSKTVFLTAGANVMDLTSKDVTPRQMYKLALGPDKKTPLCGVYAVSQVVSTTRIDNQPLLSMENVLYTNNDVNPNHWLEIASSGGGQTLGRFFENQINPFTPFTAQTVVTASYGLHQVLYTTAVGQGYTDQE